MRRILPLALVAVAAVAPVAPAADLLKYLPADTTSYTHIQTKQALSTPMLRTVLPLAFQKYGDQLGDFAGVAQAMIPAGGANAPKFDADEVKKQIKALKDPATIATAFDAAKPFAPDIIVTGDTDDPESVVVFVASEFIKADQVTAIAGMVEAFGGQAGVKLKKEKKGKFDVFMIEAPGSDQTLNVFVPEDGVLCLAMSDEGLADVLDLANGKKKSTLNDDFKKMIGQRKPTDFAFMASVSGEGDDQEKSTASVVIDKDLTLTLRTTCATEKAAKEKAEEMNKGTKDALDTVAGMADSVPDAKGYLDIAKTFKAVAKGKAVSVDFVVETAKLQKLLGKKAAGGAD